MSILIAIVSGFAWSLFDFKRKLIVANMSSLVLALWLSFWVIPIYFVLCFSTNASWPELAYWLPAAASLFVSSVATIAFIQALKVGQIALLMPILALTPVVSAILSYFTLGELLTTREVLAMIAIVVLLFLLHGGTRFRWHVGSGFMLIVAAGWGAGTVFDRWALDYAEPFPHALFQSAGMLLLFVALLVGRGELAQASIKAIPLRPIIAAACMFVVAVSAQLYALQDLHAGIIESIKRGIGTFGALFWGAYYFNEEVKRHQVVLVCLLVLAITWLVWPS